MERIKSSVLFLTIFFASNKIFSQVNSTIGSVLTMKQCVDIAIKNNLQVEQSAINMQSNGVYYNQAKDNLLPYIGASGTQALSFGRSLNTYTYQYVNQQIGTGNYGIGASLILFSGLQLQNAIKQNAYQFEASKLSLDQQKQNITLTVLLAYLQVLNSQELLDMNRNQSNVDAKQVERLELLNKEGAVSPLSNLSDLKGQYASDLVNIAAAVNTVETAKINLFQFLNIPYKKDIKLEPVGNDFQAMDQLTNSDSIFAIALSRLPGIKATEFNVRSFQKGVQVAKGQYYPTLSFNAGVNTNWVSDATTLVPTTISNTTTPEYISIGGTNYNVISPQQNYNTENLSFGNQFTNNRYTSFNLTLSVPILNYFRARNNVKLAKINLQNAQYSANATKLVLQQNVEQAYQNMIQAIDQLKSYQEAASAFAESFRINEVRFNEGVITSDVYLLSKNKMDAANINLTNAKYNYIFRSKILDYYEGKLAW